MYLILKFRVIGVIIKIIITNRADGDDAQHAPEDSIFTHVGIPKTAFSVSVAKDSQ